MTKAYRDLNLWAKFRIASFMHAVYVKRGKCKNEIDNAVNQCADWYYTDAQTVIRVWGDTHPDDLSQGIEDNNNERVS